MSVFWNEDEEAMGKGEGQGKQNKTLFTHERTTVSEESFFFLHIYKLQGSASGVSDKHRHTAKRAAS